MPWTPRDAYSHTKKADTPSKQRQWAHVANSIFEESGDEARAIREANAAVAANRSRTPRKRKS